VQDDEAAKHIHSQFIQMALQLVDGRLDSSQYEDSCRQLLGMHKSLLCLPSDHFIPACHAHPTELWCLYNCQHLCPLHLLAPMPFTILGTSAHAYLSAEGVSDLVLFMAALHCCFNGISQAEAEAILLSSLAPRSRHFSCTCMPLPNSCNYSVPAAEHFVSLWVSMLMLHKLTVSRLHGCRHQQLSLFDWLTN